MGQWFGETLSVLQMAGVALVVSALVASARLQAGEAEQSLANRRGL